MIQISEETLDKLIEQLKLMPCSGWRQIDECDFTAANGSHSFETVLDGYTYTVTAYERTHDQIPFGCDRGDAETVKTTHYNLLVKNREGLTVFEEKQSISDYAFSNLPRNMDVVQLYKCTLQKFKAVDQESKDLLVKKEETARRKFKQMLESQS